MKPEQELTAVCGIYCGACPSYHAKTDTAFAEKLSQATKRPVAEVVCEGCRPKHKTDPNAAKCDAMVCIESKKHTYCFECQDFPCVRYNPCADRAKESPHNIKLFRSLVAQRRGFEALAKESRDIWRRYYKGKKEPGCGEPKLD